MRKAISVALATAGLGLTACGTMHDPDPNSYAAQERRLEEDCRARGGILAPTGRNTGRPQVDNVCRITGEPSDRIRRN